MVKMVIILKNTAASQQLTPKAFCGVMEKIKALAGSMGKDVDEA